MNMNLSEEEISNIIDEKKYKKMQKFKKYIKNSNDADILNRYQEILEKYIGSNKKKYRIGR